MAKKNSKTNGSPKSSVVNVGLTQMSCSEDVKANRAKQIRLVEAAAKKGDDGSVSPVYEKFAETGGTQFLGYQAVRSTSRIAGIIINGVLTDSIEGPGASAEIILDQTPFYAESGGQVGDMGTFTWANGVARVVNTYAPVRGVIVHKVEMEFGKLSVNDEVQAQVDEDRRRRIAANHTGTHILHAVLRETLGTHVKQAGSLVAPDRLRFARSG